MTQIFVLGASFAYGVGGKNGGFADMIKLDMHKRMYNRNGIGKKHELYNFAKPGATIDFVLKTFPNQLKYYGRETHNKIAILLIGANNAKAIKTPDNYVSTIDEFETYTKKLIYLIKENVNQTIIIGLRPYDETKTMPKQNQLTNEKSFFKNERRELFNDKIKSICMEQNVTFLPNSISDKAWIETCLYKDDGLHPNDKGHRLIANEIMKVINI